MTLFYPEACRTAEEQSVWVTLKLFGCKVDLWISWLGDFLFHQLQKSCPCTTSTLPNEKWIAHCYKQANQRNRHYQVSASWAMIELHPSAASWEYFIQQLIPTYAVEDSSVTPEEECFWPLECEWTGITPVPPFAHGYWDTCCHWGGRRCVGARHVPLHWGSWAAWQSPPGSRVTLVESWGMSCVMAAEKQHGNRAQHARDKLVCSHPVPNTWLPKFMILCTLSHTTMTVVCPGLPQPAEATQWEGFDEEAWKTQGPLFFLRGTMTDIGRVA